MEKIFKHVLVATDGSLLADRAIALALQLGGDTRVTALMVMHDYGLPEYVRAALGHRLDAVEIRDQIRAEGQRQLEAALKRAVQGDERIERRVVISELPPSREIVATAGREGCDLIVMSSHGLGGPMAGLLGSQAQAVLMTAKVPVLVAR